MDDGGENGGDDENPAKVPYPDDNKKEERLYDAPLQQLPQTRNKEAGQGCNDITG